MDFDYSHRHIQHRYFQQFRLSVDDYNNTTSIWVHHLTRAEGQTNKGKPRYNWLSYGIHEGNIRIKIKENNETVHWRNLSQSKKSVIAEKLAPLKWLLQK